MKNQKTPIFERLKISDVCPTGFCIRSAAWTSVDWFVQYSKNGFTLPRGCSIETLYSLFKVSFITRTFHEYHNEHHTNTFSFNEHYKNSFSSVLVLVGYTYFQLQWLWYSYLIWWWALEILFMSCPTINFQWSCMNWWVIINESTCQNVKLVIRALNMEKLTRIEEEICGKLGKKKYPI